MKKRALRKDFYMEIKTSLNRFLSIFMIVALGVAFFAGLRATDPDMRLTADNYFDKSSLMDIRILSTLGLTDADVTAIEKTNGVKEVEPSYSTHVVCDVDGNELVLEVMSATEKLNKITISQGRMPQKKDEVLVDLFFITNTGYHLGDKIKIASGTEEDLSKTLSDDEFTIVGIGTTAYYLSFQRGSSNIGSGDVNSFMVVLPEVFNLEVYTTIYALVDGAKEMTVYTDKYDNCIDDVVNNLKTIREVQSQKRYNEIYNEAKVEIEKAKSEVDDGNAELKKSKSEIKDGKEELEKSKSKIEDGKEKLIKSKSEVEAGKAELIKSKSEVEAGKEELKKSKSQVEIGKAELEKSKSKIESGKAELKKSKAELNARKSEIEKSKKELENEKTKAEEQWKVQLTSLQSAGLSEEQLQAAMKELEEARIPAEKKFEEANQQIINAKQTIVLSQQELQKAELKLEQGEKQIKTEEKKLLVAEKKIKTGEQELSKAEQLIRVNELKLAKAEQGMKAGEQELIDADQKMKEGEQELAEGEQKITDGEKEILEAREIIADGEAELAKLEKPKWYVLDRSSIEAYVEFEQNADRIGAIGEVFPAIFFLVAALISLTTMTRMVEEERIEIGTLKALGYSKLSIARKYILYAFLATLGGSIFGASIGLKVLPYIIITAYKIMYTNIPKVITPFNTYYASLATLLAVLCVEIATYFACYKELRSKPASLMRPEAPKSGKRVIMERIPFLWNRLSFTWKATVRNLLRYKKRFFMTIFGIGGCMALLLVGFGLKDSIFVIYTRQFDEIMTYDASVSTDSKASAEQVKDLESTIDENNKISSSEKVRSSTAQITFDGETKNVTMIVPEDKTDLEDYVVLRKRVGHQKYTLEDDGAILTEQIAKKLGVKVGDTISVQEGDQESKVKINAITENYMTHYIYLTPQLYEKTFGKEIQYNTYFLLFPGVNSKDELNIGNSLLEMPAANGVFYTSYYQDLLSNVLVSLNIVVWVLIISAGALAFVVLYNLNNININERRRELATIKVLGFYHKEMAAYVYRENIILTIIGATVGILFGIVLHRYVITTVEIELVMFGRNIDPSSFLYSILLTFLFSGFVNFVMYFKLKKIDMVESLKSIE